jgi:signal transduction histidine kinase
MLNAFIAAHRECIVDAALADLRRRGAPAASEQELDGLPVFLDQLSLQLLRRQGLSAEAGPDIGPTAASRGELLYRLGIGIIPIVHDYGAVCHAIMNVAIAEGVCIPPDEYKLLNVCLDEAIAEALSRHSTVGAEAREQKRDREEVESLGMLAHELRNALSAVIIAFSSLKRTGAVPPDSRTGAVVERNLRRLGQLIDRSLADVRLRAAPELRAESFTLAELVAEIEGPAADEAEARGLKLAVKVDPPQAELYADRQLIVSAVSNLVQNALKFTRPRGTVRVCARADGERVRLEVEDECGGLPAGIAERLFQPFVQGSPDHSGVGLGLTIARRAAEAHGGTLRVRDKPGQGCVFTINLRADARTDPRAGRRADG